MIFRVVTEAQLEQVKDLWDYCFEKKDDPFFQYYFNEYCVKGNTVLGGFENVDDWDCLQTMVHINPYKLNLRGQEQLVPYLVGVATAPEDRGKHLMGSLMKTTFEVLRSQGIAFVTLMPIFAGIYLPYEFAFCYEKLKYTWKTGSLPIPKLSAVAKAKTLVRMQVANGNGEEGAPLYDEALQQILGYVYDEVTSGYHGVPQRNDYQWDKLLSTHALEKVQAAVVHEKGEPKGYMLYRIADNCLQIIELLAKDMDVRRRLLAFADAHLSEAKTCEFLAEPWDKSYLYFKDAGLAPQKLPFMMARCLDAKKALEQLQVAPEALQGIEESLVLLLNDSVIERNNQLLEISVHDGKLEVEKSIDKEQVAMDMASFTQLYFGALSATELWEMGKLQCTDAKKVELLDKLLPKQRNWINEYF